MTDAGNTPFAVDCVITGAANLTGMDVRRSTIIEVTDFKALKAAGLTREAADYARIRRLLEDGETVEGARLAGIEYQLRPAKREDHDKE